MRYPSAEELQNMCKQLTKNDDFNVTLDKMQELGGLHGGVRITLTVRPKDAPKVEVKIGTVFQIKARSYEVVGFNPRRYKNSVQIKRLPDGRRFICKPQLVRDGFLFQRGA